MRVEGKGYNRAVLTAEENRMTKRGITPLVLRRLEIRVVGAIATYFLGVLFFSSSSYAAPEDFIGNFSRTENATMSKCSNPAFNGTKTSFWSLRTGNLQARPTKAMAGMTTESSRSKERCQATAL